MINAHKEAFCNSLSQEMVVNWDIQNLEAERAAEHEGIVTLLWFWENKKQPTKELTQLLKSRYALHLRYRNAFRQVIGAFRQANIPVVPIRGLALSYTYGESIAFRPQSDIDLLFSPDNFLLAKQILGDIGFLPDKSYPDVFSRGSIQLDLHVEPLGITRMKSWSKLTPLRSPDFFKYSEFAPLAGEEALLVHPRVMLPYLSFHALKHSFERLIWLYDIALLANQVDKQGLWDEVLQGIQEYKLERPCFYALSYAKQHLGASVPENVLQDIKPHLGFFENRLYQRFMKHDTIPFLAERLFARMQPTFWQRLEFWRETIYPSYEVRAQIGGGSCVKCSFIRKRFKQLGQALWSFTKEAAHIIRA